MRRQAVGKYLLALLLYPAIGGALPSNNVLRGSMSTLPLDPLLIPRVLQPPR